MQPNNLFSLNTRSLAGSFHIMHFRLSNFSMFLVAGILSPTIKHFLKLYFRWIWSCDVSDIGKSRSRMGHRPQLSPAPTGYCVSLPASILNPDLKTCQFDLMLGRGREQPPSWNSKKIVKTLRLFFMRCHLQFLWGAQFPSKKSSWKVPFVSGLWSGLWVGPKIGKAHENSFGC